MLARLLDILFPPRIDEKLLRPVTHTDFCMHATLYAVAAMRPNALGLALYSDPLVRAAIHEAKYHGSTHAFTLLGALLADFLPAHITDAFDTPAHIVLIPVPLGSMRRRERGYNQVEEVILRALPALAGSGCLAVLDTTLLERQRETKTQVSLPRRERERNVKGAFAGALALRSACTAEPRTLYIVVDDVLTTGATLGACVEALVAAGVSRERILPLALAYQP